ncbi:MAG TPA: hypothetical protein VN088_05355 [Nocardioides sp.]|nr:hypothetical protein [Nocardioides sp.]
MRPHLPSLRDAAVLVVDGLARLAEAALERADAVVCAWACETGEGDE